VAADGTDQLPGTLHFLPHQTISLVDPVGIQHGAHCFRVEIIETNLDVKYMLFTARFNLYFEGPSPLFEAV
jgi:hypothetical protein